MKKTFKELELIQPTLPLSLAKIAPEIVASAAHTILIKPLAKDYELPIRTSKFLGVPYWPKDSGEYPKDKNGNPMRLLVQINFEEMVRSAGELKDYPTTGILQFFIPGEDDANQYWGLCFDKSTTTQDIEVVYHESSLLAHKLTAELEQINSINDEEYNLPIFKHCSLSFQAHVEYCNLNDEYHCSHFYEKFRDEIYDEKYEEIYECEDLNNSGCKMGGYAYFTQSDPRTEPYDETNPWKLLLQIDSVADENGQEVSMWGDVGVANLFIKKEDLINKNFNSKTVLYNWDCH